MQTKSNWLNHVNFWQISYMQEKFYLFYKTKSINLEVNILMYLAAQPEAKHSTQVLREFAKFGI